MRVARIVSSLSLALIPAPEYRRGLDYAMEAQAQNAAASPINPGALDNRTNIVVVFELR